MASIANTTWQKWHDELELAGKAKGYSTWETRAKKIVRRYRDDRGEIGASDGATDGDSDFRSGARFNILWSNVQTLMPALFAKTPKPVVERRYLDRDDIGRTASVILERAICYELDNGTFYGSLRKAVLDRLLPGRGVVWVRYEPRFSPMPQLTQEDPSKKEAPQAATPAAQAKAAGGQNKPVDEEVAYECSPVDYVDWGDFTTSPSRTWEEVWWIDKMVYMTRKQLCDRFGKEIGDKVPLDWSPDKSTTSKGASQPATGETDAEKRAKIHETWCKTDRKVYWWADGWSDEMLDEKPDPLQLEGFWPTPKPLFATLTNDSLVPVPDFTEYQDQALELDDLTTRIANITKTIKACGVYDGSVDELRRMFDEGFENKLVPCDNMAEFASKAGADGMGHIWLLPVKDMVFTLNELYKARAEVKQSLYEITGISDIVRGQSDSGAKTATEQRIKGQFASMRLNEMQAEVARFARDTLRIMGEVIAEHYDPMTLYLVSGFEQYAKEQWPPEQPKPMPQPGMGHNGGPPLEQPGVSPPPGMGAPGPGGPLPGAGMLPPDPAMLQAQAEAAARQKAAEMFKAAVELLKNDKLRGFRIDIETDSLVEPDQQATQQARTELLGAISQFLPQAIEAGSAVPELKPLMARLLMFFLRGFKASRDIEAAFEQFIDDVTKEAANPQPKPPSPEEIKAQAEMAKQKAETERMQLQAKIDADKAQLDMQMAQQKNAMDMERMQAELQIKKEELNLKREEMAMKAQQMQMDAQIKQQTAVMDLQTTAQKAQIEGQSMEREAEFGERQHEQGIEAADHKHELGLEVMDAKAKQAKKPKPEARA